MRGYVYALEAVGLEVCKIGATRAPAKRLPAIAAYSPTPVRFRHLLQVTDSDAAHTHESNILAWSKSEMTFGEWRGNLPLIDQLFSEITPSVCLRDEYPIPRTRSRGRAIRDPEVMGFLAEYAAVKDAWGDYIYKLDDLLGSTEHSLRSLRLATEITPKMRAGLLKAESLLPENGAAA